MFCFLCNVFLASTVLAKDLNIQISPVQNSLDQEKVVEIKLEALEFPDYLRIKAVSDNASVSIYNLEDNIWVSELDSWVLAPKLSERLKLKVLNNLSHIIRLSLEIQNVKLGKVYKTEALEFMDPAVFQNYLRILNRNILF